MADPIPRGDASPLKSHERALPPSIDRFRIDARLGSGGMGIVYEAWDPQLDRAIALKVLSPDQVHQPESRRRLLREARAAASLNHPHIATVYEVGSSNGVDWIAMERVHGATLRKRIRRGGHTMEEGLLWGLQVCDAIGEAHEHGVVHRDIKSMNVMVTTREQIKVLDFGLAIPSDWATSDADERKRRVTETGTVVGTVDYMAPELLRGEKPTPLSDVFALGALLWEIVSGRTPFHGRTPILIMSAILRDPVPPLGERLRDVPEGLDAVLQRALEKDPRKRHRNSRQLHDDLRAVYEALRDPGPHTTRALSVLTGEVPHNLPAAITRFVGRDDERRELMQRLEGERLLTVTGPGGAGKTRLVLEVGREVLRRFPSGVFFVDLAVRDEASQVATSVASVLQVREEQGRRLEDSLVEALRDRRMLLILDNCEHLVAACATLVAHLLQGCPELRIVTTSQERLGVPGEWVWEIPSLALPEDDAPLQEVLDSSGIQLFIDRATSVKSGFVLTEETAPTVVQICRRLDAIPLAIELAAARVRILTVGQILDRLEDRFRLLTGGGRTVLPRQQTLHNTVAWSVDLLSEEERHVFERISVFSGGFSLEAAETVCSGDVLSPEDVLDLLSRLVDKSLVTVMSTSEQPRYDQLATLREYGATLLAARDDAERVRERHAMFHLDLAEEIAPRLTGPEQAKGLAQLARETGNLKRALSWFSSARQHEAVRLGAALWRYWFVRGDLSLGRERLATALWLQLPSGDPDEGAARAKALHGAGVLANDQGDYEAARTAFQECLEIRRRLGDEHGVAQTLNSLGVAARDQGDYETARTLLQEGLDLNRRLDDGAGVASSITALGITAHREGDCDMARQLFEEGLTLRQRSGDRRGIAALLAHLGAVAVDQDAINEAERLLRQALEMFDDLGNKRGILWARMHLGGVAQKRGEPEQAQKLFCDSLRIAEELGDRHHMARALEWVAGLAVARGEPRRALRLLGAAEALREMIGSPRTPMDERAVDADRRIALEEAGDKADAFLREGRALEPQAAVREAIGSG